MKELKDIFNENEIDYIMDKYERLLHGEIKKKTEIYNSISSSSYYEPIAIPENQQLNAHAISAYLFLNFIPKEGRK